MTHTPDFPLDSIVLAWLITHAKWDKSKLAKSLATVVGEQAEASKAVSEAIDRLKTSGHVQPTRRKSITLTDSGRRKALEALGVSELPQHQKANWKWARPLLSLQSLDIPVTPKALRAGNRTNWLLANLLAQIYDITLRGDISLDRVIAALKWRALGLTQNGKLNATKVFWAITLRRAATPSTPSVIESPQTPSKNGTDLTAFARDVIESARGSATGRWHGSKIFISHVWDEFRRKQHADGMTYPQFQQRLVEAHRARLVRLSRADLVEAMSPADVHASETPYLNGTFHFLRLGEG